MQTSVVMVFEFVTHLLIAVMLSVTFTSSGPLQDARSRKSGQGRQLRLAVGPLQQRLPQGAAGGCLSTGNVLRDHVCCSGYLDELIPKVQSLHWYTFRSLFFATTCMQ